MSCFEGKDFLMILIAPLLLILQAVVTFALIFYPFCASGCLYFKRLDMWKCLPSFLEWFPKLSQFYTNEKGVLVVFEFLPWLFMLWRRGPPSCRYSFNGLPSNQNGQPAGGNTLALWQPCVWRWFWIEFHRLWCLAQPVSESILSGLMVQTLWMF